MKNQARSCSVFVFRTTGVAARRAFIPSDFALRFSVSISPTLFFVCNVENVTLEFRYAELVVLV